MRPISFLLMFLLAAAATTVAGKQHDACQPSSFFVGKCTSKVATTLQTIELNSSSECCQRCAQAAECQTWTMNTKDQPPRCFLKGPIHGQMTDGSWCTTGKRPPSPAPFPTPSGAKNGEHSVALIHPRLYLHEMCAQSSSCPWTTCGQ